MNPIELLDRQFDSSQLLDEYEIISRVLPAQTPSTEFARHRTTAVYKEGILPEVQTICPYTTLVCEELAKMFKFNFVAFRLMPPRSTFEFHVDKYVTQNYHVPVKTNDGCYFVCFNRLFNMQNTGQLYHVNSSQLHTFINAGNTDRIHLHFVNDTNGHLLRGEYA